MVKAKAKAQPSAKLKAAPLDPARQENVADRNDPRFLGVPCNRQHDATTVVSSQYSEITECSKCALRLTYVPRVGCTGRYRQKERLPAHVTEAIRAMRAEGIPFTNKAVKAMLDRVDADVRLAAIPKQPQPQPPPQQAAAAAAPAQPPKNPFIPSQDFATMFRNTINGVAQSVSAMKPPPPIRPAMEPDVWVDTPGKAPPPVYRPGQASSSAGPNIGPVATTAGMFQPENINWGAPSQQHPCPTPEHYSMATPPAAKGRAGSKRRVTYTRDGPLDATMSDRATIVSMKWLELIEQMNPRDDIKMAMRWRVHEGKAHVKALQAALAVSTPVPGES